MPNIPIDEDILECSFWPSKRKGEEYTKFEAWFYLVLHIELEGGLFSVQILALAKEWNWSRTKVRNFLELLEQENRVKIIKNQDIFLIAREEVNNKKDIEKDTKKDTEKDTKKDTEKDTEKDTKKDIKKDTHNIDNYSTYSETKDTKKNTKKNTEKNTKKDTKKDTEKNTKKDTLKNSLNYIETEDSIIDVNAIMDIMKM